MKESETPTLFDHDTAAIYEEYDKRCGAPTNAPHVAILAENVPTASVGN